MNPKLKTAVIIGFIVLVLGGLYVIHDVLLPFVFCGIFVYLLAPAVNFLTDKSLFGWKTPRGLAVILVYIGFFLSLGILALLILPPLYAEVLRITQEIPRQIVEMRNVTLPSWIEWVENINSRYSLNFDVKAFLNQMLENLLVFSRHQVEALPSNVQKWVKLLFSTLSSFLVIFIVTAFVLVDLPRIKAGLLNLVPSRLRKATLELVHAIDRDLSGAIRGQLVICLINGSLTTLGLLLLQVKFAITIGFVAGIFSLIPVFGAVISTVPAVLIALTQSPWTALAVVGVIIIIHLIEANFLNPKILGHTVELHPAIIVFAIMVGEHFFGAVGLLFGVPVAAIIRSIARYFYLKYFMEDPVSEADFEHPQTHESSGSPKSLREGEQAL